MHDFGGRKSGQASLEFLVTLAAVILVFVVASYFIYFKLVQTLDYKVYVQGTHLVNDLADSVNAVSRVGDGYSMDLDVAETLYGNRGYTINFFRGEPSIFMKGSSFSRDAVLWFSAPLATTKVACLMDECLEGCGEGVGEMCLNVSGKTLGRLANREGVVYFTPRYNVRQDEDFWYARPFSASFAEGYNVANTTIEDLLETGGSAMYLFEDVDSRELGLVFKHFSEGVVSFAFNISVPAKVLLSDDAGEFVLEREVQGEWGRGFGDPGEGGFWDGGVLYLNNTGFRVCIDHKSSVSGKFYWVNPGGVRDFSMDGGEICITYP